MKRLRAILRCLYHAVEPPLIERWRSGTCHYQDGVAEAWSYGRHANANLTEALRLVFFRPMSEEDRKFHAL